MHYESFLLCHAISRADPNRPASATNITEKVKFQFHADFLNVFNHPNYASIDAFLDDAGLASEFTGFANPYVQNGGNIVNPSAGNRSIRFGAKLFF